MSEKCRNNNNNHNNNKHNNNNSDNPSTSRRTDGGKKRGKFEFSILVILAFFHYQGRPYHLRSQCDKQIFRTNKPASAITDPGKHYILKVVFAPRSNSILFSLRLVLG